MTKLNNGIAKKAIMIMLVVVFMLVGTTSGTAKADGGVFNGGKMIESKKIIKKVQKNAWTPEPDPDSKALTLGYAISKIKEYVQADDQAIVRELGYVAKYKRHTGRKLKYSAATKGQREAIKWAVETSLISASWKSDDPYAGIDGHKILTRAELVDLLSGVLDTYYSYRVSYLCTPSYSSEGISPEMNITALYKGVVVSAPYDENKFGDYYRVNINLNASATRKDLKLSLKNLGIVTNNGIKVAKNMTGNYNYDKACNDADYFVETLYNKTGYSMSVSKSDGVVTITDGFNTVMYIEDVNGKNWYPDLRFIYSSGISDKVGGRFSATEYDVIKMLLEACILRAK